MTLRILRLDTKIAVRRLTTLLAVDGDKAVGRVDLQCHSWEKKRVRTVAEVRTLYVTRKRQGIGSRLLSECEKIARRAGCETISAVIDKDNHRVLPFYRKQGFMVSAEWDDGTLLISKSL